MTVLLGSSKTVSDGGDGPPWPQTRLAAGETGAVRARLAEVAVRVAVDGADEEAMALFDAPASILDDVRATMRALPVAPTRPAVERYEGQQFVALRDELTDGAERIVIISGLFGPVHGDAPLPAYRLPPGGTLPDGTAVAERWSETATAELVRLLTDATGPVVDLLPAEFAAAVDVAAACGAAGRDHEPIRFTRPDGSSPGTVRLKQARGALAGYLAAGKTLSRFRRSPGMRWRHTHDDAGRVLVGEDAS